MSVGEKKYLDPLEAAEAFGANLEAQCYDAVMEKHFQVNKELGVTQAPCKELFYGFSYRDIARVHFHKQGFGPCVFFRLHDGRVIDSAARRHESDPVWYDATTH